MFLSFRKKRNKVHIQFQKNLKGRPFHYQKCVEKKLLRTLEIHYKIFDNSHLIFRKREKGKINE